MTTIKVAAEIFDEWWNKKGSPIFDLIKIDCEGAELFVFRSATKALERVDLLSLFVLSIIKILLELKGSRKSMIKFER